MKLMDRASVDKQDVRQMTDIEMAALRVTVVNRTELVLQCNKCGETWAPQLDSGGRLSFDYWICPAQCNAD